MSDSVTKRLIRVYEQMASPLLFLSGFFQSPQENFHDTEEVEIDIVRSDEDISIVVQDLSTGYRMNSDDEFTNKGFKPPIHKEAFPVNSFDLLKRAPGNNPFQDLGFRAKLIQRVMNGFTKIERKIRRSSELQAAQVLQNGQVTLTDINGTPLYSLSFDPKATHFPTSGTTWGQAGATPIADLLSLCNVIRNDGLSDPDTLVFGEDAFEAFIQDSNVQARFDNRRIDLGMVAPMMVRGNGGIYRGVVEVGNYKLDVWTYGGRYKDPQTGNKVPFISGGNVVVLSSTSRLDATYGAIPNIGRILGVTGPQLLPELPNRVASSSAGIDLFVNAWLSDDGEQLMAGVGARPLFIPSAIDSYGCLRTGL